MNGQIKKKALVTGGAGFIGSHLVDALLADGFEVIGADNLITGRLENLSHLKSNRRFRLIEWDVTRPPPSSISRDLDQLSHLFHLASPASPSEANQLSFLHFPVETALVNTVGTYRMLKIARKCQAKFLFASTSEVYGDPQVHPQDEAYFGNVNSLGPRACYDEAKRMGETWVSLFVRAGWVDGKIVRIFNTYGPRAHPQDGRIISTFINQALLNQPLTIFGDGTQTRSFCYISDLVAGILLVANSAAASGQAFNLGRPEEYTVLETAKLIIKMVGSASPLCFVEPVPDDPSRRRPDISRARKLGWNPKVSFRQGLKLMIEFFRKTQ